METKDIKLSPQKGGHGHITSYSAVSYTHLFLPFT